MTSKDYTSSPQSYTIEGIGLEVKAAHKVLRPKGGLSSGESDCETLKVGSRKWFDAKIRSSKRPLTPRHLLMMRYFGFVPLNKREKNLLIAYARQKKAIKHYDGLGLDFADMKGIFLDFVEALDLYCTSEDLFYE